MIAEVTLRGRGVRVLQHAGDGSFAVESFAPGSIGSSARDRHSNIRGIKIMAEVIAILEREGAL
jgi:hypothetical protein